MASSRPHHLHLEVENFIVSQAFDHACHLSAPFNSILQYARHVNFCMALYINWASSSIFM